MIIKKQKVKDSIWQKRSLAQNTYSFMKQYGISKLAEGAVTYLGRKLLYITYPIHKQIIANNKDYFIYEKQKLLYCQERYNLSWRNERTIEIPIIQKYVMANSGANILEVGCVLRHYRSNSEVKWTIVDKYENYQGVINKDILEYNPIKKFDTIVSVSTLEHIGVEDGCFNPDKVIKAYNHIIDHCLKRGGLFVFTIPIGYNRRLDKAIYNNEIYITTKHFYRRTKNNKWIESTKEVINTPYGRPYLAANALFIGITHK